MKRVLCFFMCALVLISLVTSFTVSAEEDLAAESLAMIKLGSAAEGSTVNYFFIRDILAYRDTEGFYKHTLFDGIIFTEKSGTDTPGEIENFIMELDTGDVFKAVETAIGIFVEDGLMPADTRYPLFAAFPNTSACFSDDSERSEFCNYFINTLVSALNDNGFKYVYLAGVYFDSTYDSNPILRAACMKLAEDKGLYTVVSTTDNTFTAADRVYNVDEDINKRFTQDAKGLMFTLADVPTAENGKPLSHLKDQAVLCSQLDEKLPLLFSFGTFNTMYDCAAALEENEPNRNGRNAYECVKYILKGDYSSVDALKIITPGDNDKSEAKDSKAGRTPTTVENIVYAVLAVVAVAAMAYIIYSLIRKGKENGKK